MKIKKFLSFILIFAIAFSSAQFAVTANAYNYLGEIKDGKTTIYREDIKPSGDCLNFSLYKFSAPYDGYYLFEHGGPDGHIDGFLEEQWFNLIQTEQKNNLTQQIYYLDKGEYDFNVEVAYFEGSFEIYTAYLGESVTGITFDYDQISGNDFFSWENGNIYYFRSYADATIHFSSGKEIGFKDGELTGTMPSEYVEGENTLTIDFIDQHVPSTATVYDMSHYITDVQVSAAEDAVINYNDYYEVRYPYGETVTVTFSDGSTYSAVYTYEDNYIMLPNGQAYIFEVYCVNSEETLIFQMGNIISFNQYDFKTPKAPLRDNLELFIQECKCIIEEFKDNIAFSIENLDYKSFFDSFSILTNILDETACFVAFCFE